MADADKKPEAHLSVPPGPRIYATNCAIQGTGYDFTLIFSRATPGVTEAGALDPARAINEITGMVTMSIGTAKDIAAVLADTIIKHEKEYGAVTTPHEKKRNQP